MIPSNVMVSPHIRPENQRYAGLRAIVPLAVMRNIGPTVRLVPILGVDTLKSVGSNITHCRPLCAKFRAYRSFTQLTEPFPEISLAADSGSVQ